MEKNPQQSEEGWKKELEKVLPRIVKRGGYTIDNSATVDEVVDFISQQIEIVREEERERVKEMIESVSDYVKDDREGYTDGFANGWKLRKNKILNSLNND